MQDQDEPSPLSADVAIKGGSEQTMPAARKHTFIASLDKLSEFSMVPLVRTAKIDQIKVPLSRKFADETRVLIS